MRFAVEIDERAARQVAPRHDVQPFAAAVETLGVKPRVYRVGSAHPNRRAVPFVVRAPA